MTANDNRNYKTCLTLMSTTATGSTLSNKLTALSMKTEDPNLVKIAKLLADIVRPRVGEKDAKGNIIELGKRLNVSTSPVHKRQADAIEQAKQYCERVIASSTPEWQIIALAHGWIPPKAK